MPTTRASAVVHYEYEDVLFAVATLSQEKVGALIALERETGLRTFVQSGVSLDAHLSSDLLVSIFQRASPLHDGAVIVQRGKIAAAACFLPLTTNPGLMSSLGSRHRAAIGITEESDCLTIAVAEMTGRISVAAGGGIELGVSLDRMRLRLIQHFGPVVPPPRGSPAFAHDCRRRLPRRSAARRAGGLSPNELRLGKPPFRYELPATICGTPRCRILTVPIPPAREEANWQRDPRRDGPCRRGRHGQALRLRPFDWRRQATLLRWSDLGRFRTPPCSQQWRVPTHGRIPALAASCLCRVPGRNTGGAFERYLKSGSGRAFARRHFE
jgi:hypothetical protein